MQLRFVRSESAFSYFEALGIAYYARHDDEALCYAIYDQAAVAVVEEHREPQLDRDWFWDLAELYGVGLAP